MNIMDWFWCEKFWLMPGKTWEDYKPIDGLMSPDPKDVWTWPFITMAGLLIYRNYILIPYILTPLGKHFGVRSKPYKAPPSNAELEKLYKVNRARPPKQLLKRCAAEVGWKERQVERWLRLKALSTQMTTLEKFNDYGYQVIHYTWFMCFGLYVVATKDYCWDLTKTVENYPRTPITNELWWYYMITIGYYYGQTLLLLTHTRRHGFYQMAIHHAFTIAILVICWITNFVLMASISILVHEVADIPLLLGKLFMYCGKPTVAKYLSIAFFFAWVPTRIILYPFHVMYGTIFVIPSVLNITWPGMHFSNALLVVMLILHLIWTVELVQVMFTIWFTNENKIDPSSSPEEISDDDLKQTNGVKK